jgi:tripartite-type tricarboxylate transporter receptor subunit TctC
MKASRMFRMFKMVIGLAILSVLFISTSSFAAEEKWPSRPITVVIPFKAGGGTDLSIRAIKPGMEKFLGVPIAVVNMDGAGGALAMRYVFNQPKDGYTMLGWTTGFYAMPATGLSDFTNRDYRMVAQTAQGIATFNTAYDSPLKTMDDLIKKMRGESIPIAVEYVGGPWYQGLALFANKIGAKKFVPVPQGGGYPSAVAAMKGETLVGMSDIGESFNLVKEKRLRALAVMDTKPFKIEGLPDIPPITQFVSGISGKVLISIKGSRGLCYHRDVPEKYIEKMVEAAKFAVEKDPEFMDILKKRNWIPAHVFGKEGDQQAEIGTRVVSWLLYDLGAATRSPEVVKIERYKE